MSVIHSCRALPGILGALGLGLAGGAVPAAGAPVSSQRQASSVLAPAPTARSSESRSTRADSSLKNLERAAAAAPRDAKAQARYGTALVEAGEARPGIARLR